MISKNKNNIKSFFKKEMTSAQLLHDVTVFALRSIAEFVGDGLNPNALHIYNTNTGFMYEFTGYSYSCPWERIKAFNSNMIANFAVTFLNAITRATSLEASEVKIEAGRRLAFIHLRLPERHYERHASFLRWWRLYDSFRDYFMPGEWQRQYKRNCELSEKTWLQYKRLKGQE